MRLPTDQDLGPAWLGVLACRLVRWDTPIQLELNKVSVRQLFSRGVAAEALAASLEVLAGSALSPNLTFALRDWDSDHRAVRLWKGTVLAVEEDRRHLIEHSEHFAQAVIHRFAPGVWLVREPLLADWSKELERKGLPPLPAVTQPAAEGDWGRPWSFIGWTLDPPSVGPGPAWPDPSAPSPPADRSGRIETLLARLSALGLPPEEHEEWRARILRRTVLTEDQLSHPLGRGERVEARGLDYGGKLRLVELALAAAGDLLEIGYRDDDGKTALRLVRPVRLEKQGGEALLVAEDWEGRKPFTAWVSRLSQVRKIKGSLLT